MEDSPSTLQYLPVRVVVFTVAPDEDQEAYLQLLSAISRRFRNPELIEKLIDSVGNTVEMLELVTAPAEA